MALMHGSDEEAALPLPLAPEAAANSNNGSLGASPRMAIAVGHFHDLNPPAVRDHRHYSLHHSVAMLDDSPLLDRDHTRDHADAAVGAGNHTGLSPRRRSQSSPCFTTTTGSSEHAAADRPSENKLMPRVEIVAGRHARGVRELIAEAAVAIASGTRLVPAQSGLGGALLLNGGRAGDEHVAVIKPLDENGGGYESRTVLREVAAFLLDHDGFASVEPTALIKISRPAGSTVTTTVASIQRFVAHEYDAGELGPSRFSVASVHRVGILDVRLLNIDRHAGNILVKNTSTTSSHSHGGLELVPIDHGLCLPEQLDDPYFEWLHWPQSSLPFSGDELAYVAALDPLRDAETLRAELPALREPAIRILTVCTVFLQRAAAAGLCLADIGDMMTREFVAAAAQQQDHGLSTLEALCKQAHDDVHPPHDGAVEETVVVSGGGRKHVSFGDLSVAEWEAFLERFEQLLPAALEDKKRAGLGTPA